MTSICGTKKHQNNPWPHNILKSSRSNKSLSKGLILSLRAIAISHQLRKWTAFLTMPSLGPAKAANLSLRAMTLAYQLIITESTTSRYPQYRAMSLAPMSTTMFRSHLWHSITDNLQALLLPTSLLNIRTSLTRLPLRHKQMDSSFMATLLSLRDDSSYEQVEELDITL